MLEERDLTFGSSGRLRSGWGSLVNDRASFTPTPRRRHSRRGLLGAVLVVLVLGLGLVAALLASQTNLDLRQFAWGGVNLNTSLFQQRWLGPNLQEVIARAPSQAGVKEVFHQLTRLYWDADVVNISLPQFDFNGVAFKAYEPSRNVTYIFARLNNVPWVEGKYLALWLEGNDGSWLYAGSPEYTIESGVLVAYFTFPLEGKVDQYRILHITSDKTQRSSLPGDDLLAIAFAEDQP